MEKKSNQILVGIYCITYNHKNYLRQCLDGFVMQKTNFRFVAVVHDDCSTDGTTEILREYVEKYPKIIHPIYEEENQYCKHDGSIDRIMNDTLAATRCKYIAICEGDDYWTDPYKLQKQVDFLDAHEDYGMCVTNCLRWQEINLKFDKQIIGKGFVYDFENILLNEPSIILTSMYRHVLYKQYRFEINPEQYEWQMGDTPLLLWFSANSKIYNLNEVTAVYRRLQESASHSLNVQSKIRFNKSAMDIRLFFCKKYPDLGNYLIKQVKNKNCRTNMSDASYVGDLYIYLKYFFRLRDKRQQDYIECWNFLCKKYSILRRLTNRIKQITHYDTF